MRATGSARDDAAARGARLRQRLWGAAVLIAALVIVLPLLLDGAGSESRFRRVERLREEPPRVLDPDGRPEPGAEPGPPAASGAPPRPVIRVGEDDPPDYLLERETPRRAPPAPPPGEPGPAAWVVQAGSFAGRDGALAVRDRLRRAGYPSFVVEAGEGGPFRVRVGPMIDRARAGEVRTTIERLLGRGASVTGYP